MNIAIVGAGRGGTKIMDLFNDFSGVNIVSVIDQNLQSPGILRAKALGIHCSAEITEIDNRADIIIEATGSPKVLEIIKSNFSETKRIVESDVAKLLMTIVDQKGKMTERLNYQLEEINTTCIKLHDEMNKIVDVTENLNKINKKLVDASEESKSFIEKTDEMIHAVNKITQQIKILGLNANIEAARAGKQGRCFSVVAAEVQRMSNITRDFANQISDLLNSLRIENESIANEVSKLDNISTTQQEITQVAKNIVDELQKI